MYGVLAILALENEERNAKRRHEMLMKELLRDISDPFMMGDDVFHGRYRMYPDIAIQLIETLRPFLHEDPNGIPIHLQILAVVRYLAEGSYQKGVAYDVYHPMSKTTFTFYLHTVIPALLQIADNYIKFPETREERLIVQHGFHERLGFPGVLGAVDCTLPRIRGPSDHEEAYVNYKNEHSLCVQVICDVNYNIMNLRVTSGSTNDRFVWRHSEVRQQMLRLRNDKNLLREEMPYFLIADNGYTPSTILLTPIAGAERGTADYRYSDTIRRSRCRIEQTIGLWKQIARCINGERTNCYEPHFAADIVLASGVLYNFLRHHGMPFPDPLDNDELEVPYLVENEQEYHLGLAERQRIIDLYFNEVN